MGAALSSESPCFDGSEANAPGRHSLVRIGAFVNK